jgi:hypothetical protein
MKKGKCVPLKLELTSVPPSLSASLVPHLLATRPPTTVDLPLDVYILLLPFLPTLDCHLALSDIFSLLRRSLYSSDSHWLRLLLDYGWSYGCVRGEG